MVKVYLDWRNFETKILEKYKEISKDMFTEKYAGIPLNKRPDYPYLQMDAEMQQVFQNAAALQRSRNFVDDPAILVFQQLALHPTISPALERRGHSRAEVVILMEQLPKKTLFPGYNSRPLQSANICVEHVADRIARERGGSRITVKDMTLAFLTLQPPPLDIVFDRLRMDRFTVIGSLEGSF